MGDNDKFVVPKVLKTDDIWIKYKDMPCKMDVNKYNYTISVEKISEEISESVIVYLQSCDSYSQKGIKKVTFNVLNKYLK